MMIPQAFRTMRSPSSARFFSHGSLITDAYKVTSELISVISSAPFSPPNPKLQSLAPFLTTKIVEAVLSSTRDWRLAHAFFLWASSQPPYKHNIYTFNTMASILANVRRNDELKSLSSDVISSSCSMTPGSLGFLLRCLGRLELTEDAIALFDQAKEKNLCAPNCYTYNCLLEAIRPSNNVQLAEEKLREMNDSGISPDNFTFSYILQIYCDSNELQKASQVFSHIVSLNFADPIVCTTLILAHTKQGQVEAAFDLLNKAEQNNILFTAKTFSVIIHAFAKENRHELALLVLQKMKIRYVPDVPIYDVLIGGFCKDLNNSKAMELFAEMISLGLKADQGIIHKISSSISETSDFHSIFHPIIPEIDEDSRAFLLSSLMSRFLKDGHVLKAYRLIDFCTHNGLLKDYPFATIITALLNSGYVDLGTSLFRKLPEFRYVPDLPLHETLIKALCNNDRTEEAFSVLQQLKDRNLEPSQATYNFLYGSLAGRTDVPGALSLVKEMRLFGHEPYVKHTASLLRSLCETGNLELGKRFLNDLGNEGFPPNVIPYSVLLNGYVNGGKVDVAIEIFNSIASPDMIAHNIILKGLCRGRRIAEAERFFSRIAHPSTASYNILIDGYCKTNEVEKGVFLSAQMAVPSTLTYTILVDAFCRNRDVEKAVKTWELMVGTGCVPSRVAYMAMISGMCRFGKADVAGGYLREMEERGMRADAYVYVGMVDAYVSESEVVLGFGVVERMVELGICIDLKEKVFVGLKESVRVFAEDFRTCDKIRVLIEKGFIRNFD